MTEANQTSRPVVGRLEASVSPQAWGPGQFVVVATFRYCLGRQTYIVQECADWLLLHWPVIEQPVRNLIQRELERAFEQDDRARAGDAQLDLAAAEAGGQQFAQRALDAAEFVGQAEGQIEEAAVDRTQFDGHGGPVRGTPVRRLSEDVGVAGHAVNCHEISPGKI